MRKKDDFLESYNTAEWQRKKNKILERDNYTCQICGDTESAMQVHHISYKHCNGKAYNALDNELITLCPTCHSNDDGDHLTFYNGTYEILPGGELPVVVPAKPFGFPRWSLLRFKMKGYSEWHIGFFSELNWVEQMTQDDILYPQHTNDELNYEDAEEVYFADDDDAVEFTRIFEDAKSYLCKEDIWFVDKEKYEEYKSKFESESVLF